MARKPTNMFDSGTISLNDFIVHDFVLKEDVSS